MDNPKSKFQIKTEPKSKHSESQLQMKLETTCLFFWMALCFEGMGVFESKATRCKTQVALVPSPKMDICTVLDMQKFPT